MFVTVGARVGASNVGSGGSGVRVKEAGRMGTSEVAEGANTLGAVKMGSVDVFAPREHANMDSAMTSPAARV